MDLPDFHRMFARREQEKCQYEIPEFESMVARHERRHKQYEKLIREDFEYIPPSYEKPDGVEVTEDDQREEDEYRREFGVTEPAMWTLGEMGIKGRERGAKEEAFSV